ncbi:TonB-dependent receptor [Empedobacter falsenii]|uniref:TonB-dependent receptor n=1 Tax=Empedobacter falsenii TaxID=343874 RepID=A0AAW7DK56_9FLAO|nr:MULTISPECIES: TonB-dependent receptor [Empedobacter]HBX62078.1 nicotinate-nucleotide adenylyltransferase [Flavobacteriaceae bacterium]MDH2207814.1 TonB-dependent receptor [Empedobacter sp. GD03644]MDM1063133.1 TonB-dependent receptor [Empedobacter falsenii]MDM1547962.1 TonB-dependent receptor [Empedobacter falsenii]MDM1552384.1 TonB-dependent receptor [Empedobacter falsenii]
MALEQVLTPKQKALEINLNPKIYGSFAEIGAGQETVRFFYRAGAASGTVAKAMSAYDKEMSDSIYGVEENRRYVTQARLKKMLDHEMELMKERLIHDHYKEKAFFTYANTVTTIDYSKKNEGQGWIGLRFKLNAEEEKANEIIFHVKFKENTAQLQQETLGVLGVNLIYGAYYYYDNPRKLIKSLYDTLDKDQLEIDMINFRGPQFKYVDNRLMSLQLVKNGMTDVAVFNPQGKNILPADLLYKKNIFAVRGSFRPFMNVNMDMFKGGLEIFKQEDDVRTDNTEILFEITLSNLIASGFEGELNERDFLDRADIIGSLGYNVIISNFSEYYKLVDYFSKFTRNQTKVGLAMGVNNLVEIFNEQYYADLPGGIMEAFGKLFKKNVKVYLYPYLDKEKDILLTSKNLQVSDSVHELYKYFLYNGRIQDILNYNRGYLDSYSRRILEKIANAEQDWENECPEGVADMIKDRGMFGYKLKYILE